MQRSSEIIGGTRNKRHRDASNAPLLCSFCHTARATVEVLSHPSKQSVQSTKLYLCFNHYYTSRNARIESKRIVNILSESKNDADRLEHESQLSSLQDIFAESFLELQSEIGLESARSSQWLTSSDPLASLLKQNQNSGRQRPKRRSREPRIENKQASSDQVIFNPYKRKQSSKQNIWNVAKNIKQRKNQNVNQNDTEIGQKINCGSCQSLRVERIVAVSSLHDQVAKADTWGFKREDEVTTRYRCLNCGYHGSIQE